MDSPKDDVNQLKNNLLDYVEAVVRAVAEYAGYNYVAPGAANTYTVKSGDSLWKIANEYGVTVDELKKANNLSSNVLNIGQILKIPTKEVESDNIYIVKSGDSLWKIANEYDVTVDELKKANNLTSNVLSIGQKLVIPLETVASDQTYYTVQSGDSLWNIAKRYGVSVDELKKANNLSSNLLTIGQKLIIPGENFNNHQKYVVQSGDSLWKIANKYNVSVDDLIKLNNLNNTLLSIGQELLIP